MNIELKEMTIRELINCYRDNKEDGRLGHGSKPGIRPPYQREFTYKDSQRDAVIDTVTKGFPLNLMYWGVREDGGYELIDGQQRATSIVQFIEGVFAFNGRYFHNLQHVEREQILNYKLTTYLCSGNGSEKMEWFRTINIAGKKLTNQELRNVIYPGPWVSDAKRYFSKNNCVAYNLGGDYLSGSAIKQDYLETAIKWISNDCIVQYMTENQHKPNANEIWFYFQDVINWVKTVFPKYHKKMKSVAWGFLYNSFKDRELDPKKIEQEVAKMMEGKGIKNIEDIYACVLADQ